jgi:hypothetical protein
MANKTFNASSKKQGVKKFFSQFFGSLISNNTALEGAHYPYWQSLIIVFLSVVIALIPGLVSTLNNTGSSRTISKSANASLDISLTALSKELAKENSPYKITIGDDGKLVAVLPETTDSKGNTINELSINHVDNGETRELLAVRYVKDSEISNDESLNKIVTYYRDGYKSGSDEVSPQPRSVMILSESSIYVYAFSSNAKNEVVVTDGVKTITSEAAFTVTFGGLTSTITKGTDVATFYTGDNAKATATAKWATLFDEAYSSIKTQTLFISLAIYATMDVGMILLLALIVMILTRLKSSKGEKLNYIGALKATNWATFSPAVIGMLIAFMIGQYGAMLGFVLVFGVRAIFLGMKASNPNPAK